jgi:hypothetical protein
MDEGVFIGPKSNGRSAKVSYVRYLSTAVQRLSRTSRYYPEGIPKSSRRLVLMAYVRYYSITVQRLFRMIRYYIVDYVNSTAYVCPKVGVRLLYYSQSTNVLFVRPYIRWGTIVRLH